MSKGVNELMPENLIWKGDEISALNHLKTFSLSNLNLRKITRGDLPENLERIENLWLK